MSITNECQNQDLFTASRPVTSPLVAKYRLQWHIRREGFWRTLSSAGRLLLRRFVPPKRRADSPKPLVPHDQEILRLQPGEWVEVKSEAEIRRTLDASGRNHGLLFMAGMAAHCGRRLRVYKRLERMIVETTGELRRVKNTVLLEDSMCSGVGMSCDRSCHFFWREAWLKRANAPADPASPTGEGGIL